jgi:hypothetical protein
MTYTEIVTEIEQLPQMDQQALLRWLVQHARLDLHQRDRSQIPPASELLGIARPAGPMPTDEELKADYVNYLAEKYR